MAEKDELDKKMDAALARLEVRPEPEPPPLPPFIEAVVKDLRLIISDRHETATDKHQTGWKVLDAAGQPQPPADAIADLFYSTARLIQQSGASKAIDWKPGIYKNACRVVQAFDAIAEQAMKDAQNAH